MLGLLKRLRGTGHAPDGAAPPGAVPAGHGLRARFRAWWDGYYLDPPQAQNDDGAPAAAAAGAPADVPGDAWPASRIKVAELVWGEGFSFPGGPEFARALAAPLGLAGDRTLLEFGCGLGGIGRTLARELGVAVTGYEESAALAAAAMRVGDAGARIAVHPFEPETLKLPAGKTDAVLVRSAFWWLPDKPRFLAELAQALRPGGVLLVEDFAVARSGERTAALGRWLDASRRSVLPCTLDELSVELARLKLDLRIAEDASAGFRALIAAGWARVGTRLESCTLEPGDGGALMRELASWETCLAAFAAGDLRMIRVCGVKPEA